MGSGRDHHAPQAERSRGVHLPDGVLDAGGQRDHGDPDPAIRVGPAEVGQPPVVGPGAFLQGRGVDVLTGTEARAKGGAGQPAGAEHVGVRKQDFSRDSLLVEDSIPRGRVVSGPHVVVAGLRVPFLDELGVDHPARRQFFLMTVEGLAKVRRQIVPVHLRGRAGMAIG